MNQSLPAWNNIFKSPHKYQYYDLSAPHEDMAQVADVFKKNQVQKILDVGCGLGNNLFFLNKLGFTIEGIDAALVAIEKIKNQAKVQVADFRKLPFAKNVFDAVISVQTLNHGYEEDVLRGIKEIERVLKPQGLIFITLPGRISQGKVRLYLVKTAQKVAAHTYLPTQGEEKGVSHVIFNKELIKKYFKNFKFVDFWKDSKDYYCLVARKIY